MVVGGYSFSEGLGFNTGTVYCMDIILHMFVVKL